MSATYIGYLLMVAGGFLLVALLLAASAMLVGLAGQWLFKRMRRIYQLTTIWYWLDQMEKGGTHCFPKPTKESR